MTSSKVVGLVWSPTDNDGGTPVIDYTIYFTTQDSLTFAVLIEGVTELTYTTVVPLITGTTYKFMVQARNTVGLGAYSSPVEVLLA